MNTARRSDDVENDELPGCRRDERRTPGARSRDDGFSVATIEKTWDLVERGKYFYSQPLDPTHLRRKSHSRAEGSIPFSSTFVILGTTWDAYSKRASTPCLRAGTRWPSCSRGWPRKLPSR